MRHELLRKIFLSSSTEQLGILIAGKSANKLRTSDDAEEDRVVPHLAPVDWSQPTPGAVISERDDETGDTRKVRLGGRSYAFVKITPDSRGESINKRDLKLIAARHRELIAPIAMPWTRLEVQRNSYGAIVWPGGDKDGATGDRGRLVSSDVEALAATQLKETTELWSVDTWLLDNWLLRQKVGRTARITRLLRVREFEEAFERALPRFASFALLHLKQRKPIRIEFGIQNISEHRLALGDQAADVGPVSIDGGIYGDTITISEDLTSSDWREVLLPFFKKIWLAFDRERPEKFRT